ncbi:MAG: sulfite exporter TauE/SafE family protein [Methanoregula sp.]|uniref:sulfite exporter TauE/SafE family protein n=1 Tax=Methanoregula sp. TaxID=2052170 RepID=UPI003BAEB038
MIEYFAAGLIAIGIGIIAAIIGLGGGFFYVPTLSLIFGLDTKTAIGTSLTIMIFSAMSASYWYRKQGIILYRVALIMIIPSMIASVIGTYLTTLVDARILVFIFCVMLTLISLEMLIPAFRFLTEVKWGPSFVLETQVDHQGKQPVERIWYSHLVFWGFAGGLLSGVTGTSGGALFVPALATAGIPVHYAIATSMFTIILVSITGATAHASIGQISWPFVAVYGAGAAFGAFIGANVAPKIKEQEIKKIFGCLLLFIAVLMFQQKVLMGI